MDKYDETIDMRNLFRFSTPYTHNKFPEYQKQQQSQTYVSSPERNVEFGSPVFPGCVGLSNFSMNCYMNSLITALSNTEKLSCFFLSNQHLKELNIENPLGYQGKIALEYGKLIQQIWSGKYKKVTPCRLKEVTNNIQNQLNIDEIQAIVYKFFFVCFERLLEMVVKCLKVVINMM
jgi:ubiquitin C-terminal hydrolase